MGRGRGAAAGCSSAREGPPARSQPMRAIQVDGGTVAGGTSVAAGSRYHPEKCGPELRGSMHGGSASRMASPCTPRPGAARPPRR
ncbi:MAG TPA: hypothetical protein VMT03_17725 [Polyangia bacterium]|nr:hypothetical protein [Polyangia bacterium]